MLKDITKTQKEYFLETGITLYQLQTFERMLKVLLTLVNPINDPSNTSDQCKDYQFLEKKPLDLF